MNVSQERTELPALVKKIRGDMSQENFAHELGVTKGAVHQWEAGKIWLSLESAIALIKWTKQNRDEELVDELLRVIGATEVVA
jgi:DNA-binding transcriptional regulator YiaG